MGGTAASRPPTAPGWLRGPDADNAIFRAICQRYRRLVIRYHRNHFVQFYELRMSSGHDTDVHVRQLLVHYNHAAAIVAEDALFSLCHVWSTAMAAAFPTPAGIDARLRDCGTALDLLDHGDPAQ